jgi:capsular exopolysaccharide synthesis family protein
MSEGDVRLLPITQQANPALESYRLLRTNIQFASIDEPVKTLLVASSSPGEGKSTTAVNLAFAMALDGKRVILVDSDLRRPSLHERFMLPRQPGLTDVLLDNARLEDVLTPQENSPSLSVIPAGSLPPNPSELLNSRKFYAVCTQLAEGADIVIFDSPPLLVAADGAILASQIDGTILVIESGETRKSSARAALAALEQARARVLGVVHNKLKASLKEGYDYHGYSPYRHPYICLPETESTRNGSAGAQNFAAKNAGRTSEWSSGAGDENKAHDRDA